MALYTALDIAASGLTAQRLRMDLIADNIANANTTRTAEGGPFRRKLAVFVPRNEPPPAPVAPGSGWAQSPMPYHGVRVVGIVNDTSPFRMVYDPGHPDADYNGNVFLPNVDPIMEMVDLIESNRAYEANLSVFETTKQLLMRTLTIGR
ncbi:MAG TPA: flagellar basal body rod protein FlgC [Firmicutes bacterium]|nr:flagellar basal body rod protein FlgC [Bacillota bacterium]